MKKFNLFFIIAFLMQQFNYAIAQTIPEIPPQNNLCTSGYTVFFINGINTFRFKAKIQLDKIKTFKIEGLAQTGENYSYKNESVKFELTYNSTQKTGTWLGDFTGLIKDTLETFRQKTAETYRNDVTKLREELKRVEMGVFAALEVDETTLQNFTPEKQRDVRDIMKDLKEKIQKSLKAELDVGNGADVSYVTAQINNELLERRKIIVFAHSQGNLVSQQVYLGLDNKYKQGAIKFIHVGTPTATTINGSEYVTNMQDGIMNKLRWVTNILPGNIDIGKGCNNVADSSSCHAFNEIYANSQFSNQYQKILSAYKNAMNSVKSVEGETGKTGAFTIAMGWDGIGDIDLHVVEPNNNEVYYSNQKGTSGDLDTDNTYANGPEHYSSSCDATKVQEGTYQIFAKNYARGEGRTATLFAKSNKAGFNSGDKKVTFTKESPNFLPFSLKVTNKLENGKRIFKVDLM